VINKEVFYGLTLVEASWQYKHKLNMLYFLM
jgi:hypothetical protein